MVKGTTKRSGSRSGRDGGGAGRQDQPPPGDVDYSEIQGTALASVLARAARADGRAGAVGPARRPRTCRASATGSRAGSSAAATTRRLAPSTSSTRRCTGRHPYGLPSLGTRESLRSHRPRGDRRALPRVLPSRAHDAGGERSGVGDGSDRRGAAALRRHAGERHAPRRMRRSRRRARPAAVGSSSSRRRSRRRSSSARLAPSLDHPDHAAVKVLSTVLGGGMAGRLFVELRDKQGARLHGGVLLRPVHEPGALILYLGTAPENAARAEDALVARSRACARAGAGRRAGPGQGLLLGRYAMDRRTNERQAWYLASTRSKGVGLEYPARYRARGRGRHRGRHAARGAEPTWPAPRSSSSAPASPG